MKIYKKILGNIWKDSLWRERSHHARVRTVHLDGWMAQKTRLLAHDDRGTVVPISVERCVRLTDGDVLDFCPEEGWMLLLRVHLNEVLEIAFNGATGGEERMRAAFELGHAIGNQHWPAVVKGERVFVPLTVDKTVMLSVLNTHHIEGADYCFRSGVEVIPYLAPHEVRRLFGGTLDVLHTHENAPSAAKEAPSASPEMGLRTRMIHLFNTLQCADSAFPVGSFAFSCGLEAAVGEQVVTSPESLRQYIITQMSLSAYTDGIASLHAYRSRLQHNDAGVTEADNAVKQCKMNEEMRRMQLRMGGKLRELAMHLIKKDFKEAETYPVVQGLLFAELGLTECHLFVAQQYGVVNTLLNAALRCMRISHFDTQNILFSLSSMVVDLYREVSKCGLGDMQSFAPQTDFFASQHEHGGTRMFMN
jgi:urease accessory protein UreF/urease accessory protein UreE